MGSSSKTSFASVNPQLLVLKCMDLWPRPSEEINLTSWMKPRLSTTQAKKAQLHWPNTKRPLFTWSAIINLKATSSPHLSTSWLNSQLYHLADCVFFFRYIGESANWNNPPFNFEKRRSIVIVCPWFCYQTILYSFKFKSY